MRRAGRNAVRWRPVAATSLSRLTEQSPALASYFAEIRRIPVLEAEHEAALAKQLREARAALRDELGQIPGCVALLVREWRSRRKAERVAASICEAPEADPAFERRLDDLFAEAAQALSQLDEASPSERRRLGQRLSAAFAQVDPRTDLLLSWLAELQSQAEQPTAGLARELGLPRPPPRQSLARAHAHRRNYYRAKDMLVSHNLRLVVHIAKDFRHLDIPFSDLIQEGNLGLIRAVEKFDERRGVRLTTYAAWWIAQGFIRAFQKQGRSVRLPAHVYQRLMELRRLESEFERLRQRAPSLEEIAAGLGLTQEEVTALLQARARVSSLDEVDAAGKPSALVGRLHDSSVGDPVEAFDSEILRERIHRLLEVLDARERRIVSARFGLAGGEERTLQDLGDELGISRERVRQIEKRALERLSDAAGAQHLEHHLV